jgi:hypothetical protein
MDLKMDEFSDIWIEQCGAAREIRDAWGIRKALGYLVGEKLLNYIRASDTDPSWVGACQNPTVPISSRLLN